MTIPEMQLEILKAQDDISVNKEIMRFMQSQIDKELKSRSNF